MKSKNPSANVRFCVLLCLWAVKAAGQGTISFDGPPLLAPGSAAVVQEYYESGMWFRPLPGTDGFTRVWSNSPSGWPNDGTPYILSGAVDTLAFSFTNGAIFGVSAVDLAGFSSSLPDFAVTFVGYHSDGSTITTTLSGSGASFKTYYFDSSWSSALARVEIPNYGWSLDNLVIRVPEPSVAVLAISSAAGLAALQIQKKGRQQGERGSRLHREQQ